MEGDPKRAANESTLKGSFIQQNYEVGTLWVDSMINQAEQLSDADLRGIRHTASFGRNKDLP